MGHVLIETGYREMLVDSGTTEDSDRLANLDELLSAAREFDERNPEHGLEEFLEGASLASDTDAWDAGTDRATLMTLHASKGLEFSVVYIAALEEGIIPHSRSVGDANQLEEERRLLFVGMTRAQTELHLTIARQREFRGQRRMSVPSFFLGELPRHEMTGFDEAWAALSAGSAHDSQTGTHTAEVDEYAQIGPGDDPADVASDEFPLASDAPAKRRAQLTLRTAAQLAGDVSSSAIDPETFSLGMVVMHPELGIGRVVALGGGGVRRTVTVQFANSPEQRQFVAARSPLRPLGNGM